MKNAFLLLLISMTFMVPINLNANSTDPYSREELIKEFDLYKQELISFMSELKDVPENFTPQALIDFEDFVENDFDNKILNLEIAYKQLIDYIKDYENHHGVNSFKSIVDSEPELVQNMPLCFQSWHREEMNITLSSLQCCDQLEECANCISDGIILSYMNMVAREECLLQNYNSK